MRKDEPDYRVGCGRCEACTSQKSQEWAIRMAHESQYHERNSFLTLTYENAPEKINKHDLQIFLKRLRRRSETPLRYFITGEYGEITRRPHYHAIIFGEDFLGGSYGYNDQLYCNPVLDKCWEKGIVTSGEFTLGAAMYVAGYVGKKIGDKDTFSIMSRNPPLGMDWVREHSDNLRRLESVVLNGQEFPIPSTYLRWLDGIDDFGHIKENRRQNAITYNDRQLDNKRINKLATNNLKREKI